MESQWSRNYLIILGFTLSFVLVLCGVIRAGNLPTAVLERLTDHFPGAQVTEVEPAMWEGQSVLEVDLITTDGVAYQVLVTETGEILEAEKEDDGLPWVGGELLVGFGVRAEKELYRDTDTEVSPVPFLRYENGAFQIQAYDDISASYRVFGSPDFGLSIKGGVDMGGGYDTGDSRYFNGMDKLNTIYTLGASFESEFGGWTAGIEFTQDVSGEHNGQEIEVALGHPLDYGKLEIRPTISATWISKKNVDYFYGVSAREARPDRPAYSPGSSYEIGAELMLLYSIFDDLQFVATVEVAKVGDEIKDSPLVDEDHEVEAVVGLVYTF